MWPSRNQRNEIQSRHFFETFNSKFNYGKAAHTVKWCDKLIIMHFFPLSDRSADIKKYTEQIQSWDPGPVLFTPVPGFKHSMTGIPQGN